MPWVKIDDGFYDNGNNRRMGAAGRDLFIAGLAHCAKGLTDGRIPKEDLPLVLALAQAKRSTVAKLVKAGRWIEHGDHYEVDEYLTYQPSRAQVLAEREAARERQRRARGKSRESRRDIDRESQGTDGVSHGHPDPTRPRTTTPQPPASGGPASHNGQHTNCRQCGTNTRGKPAPTGPRYLPDGSLVVPGSGAVAPVQHHESDFDTALTAVRDLKAHRTPEAS